MRGLQYVLAIININAKGRSYKSSPIEVNHALNLLELFPDKIERRDDNVDSLLSVLLSIVDTYPF